MAVEQISVFVENTSGRLAEVTRLLAGAGINLRAITIADTADFGILRIIADNSSKAVETFKKAGFTAKVTQVIGVEVPDKPGGLAGVMEIFNREGVNIEYLYASLEHVKEKAVIIFKVEDVAHGLKICQQHGLSQISQI